MSLSFGDHCPIGVFDSGLGGLSVLSEIHRLLPNEKLIYVGDSANAPYGDGSSQFIRERSVKIADFLIEQGVKALVIACITATAEAITMLREHIDIPIIGLEPAIKPATKISTNRVIGLLATQRTINSERLLSLTELYAQETKVIAQACTGLVEQIEAYELNSEATYSLLNQYIQPLLKQGADTLILGCTHYPFVLPAIRNIVGDHILILDTAKPVALQLQRVLKEYQLEHTVTHEHCSNTLEPSTDITFYNTMSSPDIKTTMQQLWNLSTPNVTDPIINTKISPTSTKAIEVLPLPR